MRSSKKLRKSKLNSKRTFVQSTWNLHSEFVNKEAGLSLVEVLIGVGLVGFLALGLSKLHFNSTHQTKALSDREEIATLRQNIESNISCTRTLNISPSTVLPLNCSNFRDIVLRKENGEPLKSGTWGIKGTCRNNELIIAVDKPGNDPLTNQPWNTLRPGIDLFSGLGKFCSEYFLNSQCNASAYPLFLGFETNGPRCCRSATAIGLSSATATCASSEFAISGGHSCNTADTGFIWPASTPPDVMGYVSVSRSVMGADGRSWTSDCRSNDSSIPINAKSVVYCCPL